MDVCGARGMSPDFVITKAFCEFLSRGLLSLNTVSQSDC